MGIEIGIVIVLLVVSGSVCLKLTAVPKHIKDLCKNRTTEQKKVIKYFLQDACLRTAISDTKYDEMILKCVNGFDAKETVKIKMALDESDLQEMEPIQFNGFFYDGDQTFGKGGKDGVVRSSAYQISWLFFSSTQVYLYQHTFHMDKDESYERIDKYSYEDITILFTAFDIVKTSIWSPQRKSLILEDVNSARFCLIAPENVSFGFMELYDYTEGEIQMIRRKIREKNNA